MSKPLSTIRLGTRGSALARWQTDYVANLLRHIWPGITVTIQVITTKGDTVLDTPLPLIGGKGVFTAEIETALKQGEIDCAVHSLKDLPTESPEDLTIGAIPPRANVQDVLISRSGSTLQELASGATIGTSSKRRAAQLLHLRPDLNIVDIRGNVDTRIRKAQDPMGVYDGAILAAAGVERLGLTRNITEMFPLELMLPAPGQGALAVQCRDDANLISLLAPLNDPNTQIAVTAERAFLAGLGGGCSLPIAAHARIRDSQLYLHGRVNSPDGQQQQDYHLDAPADLESAQSVGLTMADQALQKGAAALLENLV